MKIWDQIQFQMYFLSVSISHQQGIVLSFQKHFLIKNGNRKVEMGTRFLRGKVLLEVTETPQNLHGWEMKTSCPVLSLMPLFPPYINCTLWHLLLVDRACLTLCDPMDCSLPGSSFHGISQQEYCSGLPFPSPGEDLPDPGVEWTLVSCIAGRFFNTEPPGKPEFMK